MLQRVTEVAARCAKAVIKSLSLILKLIIFLQIYSFTEDLEKYSKTKSPIFLFFFFINSRSFLTEHHHFFFKQNSGMVEITVHSRNCSTVQGTK